MLVYKVRASLIFRYVDLVVHSNLLSKLTSRFEGLAVVIQLIDSTGLPLLHSAFGADGTIVRVLGKVSEGIVLALRTTLSPVLPHPCSSLLRCHQLLRFWLSRRSTGAGAITLLG